jgi:hypothetical protein
MDGLNKVHTIETKPLSLKSIKTSQTSWQTLDFFILIRWYHRKFLFSPASTSCKIWLTLRHVLKCLFFSRFRRNLFLRRMENHKIIELWWNHRPHISCLSYFIQYLHCQWIFLKISLITHIRWYKKWRN